MNYIQSWHKKDRYEKVEVIAVSAVIIVLVAFAVICH